ncbi:MAG TPA: magnesium transporter, partial [Alphaproteobacteria bacterium]|nr:magnesium transporter [Alphaproteobacteria bacterium]
MQDAATRNDEDASAAGGDGDAVYALTPTFVHAVIDALDIGDGFAVTDLVEPLHAADMADLLGLLRGRQRYQLLDILGSRLNP